MRNSILLIILFTSLFAAQAQTQKTAGAIDTLTYQQFFQNDYKALQKTGKEAIKEGIDFYFLRTRLGISYYNQKNYESALPHFKVAQKIFPMDTLIQEYYYYSLIFTGRKEDAYDLAKGFTQSMQQKVGFEKHNIATILKEISITGGISGNNNLAKYDSLDIKDTNIYAEGTFQGGATLASIVLKTKITHRSSITAGFSYFENKSMGRVLTYDSSAIKTYWNNPYQINVAIDYLFPMGLKLGGAVGVYHEASNYYNAVYNDTNFTFTYSDNPRIENPYTASIFATYRWNRFEFFATGSMGNLASKKQKQGEVGIAYYPFGNQNFYSVTSGTMIQNDTTQAFIIHQKFGGKAYKNFWYEVSASYGDFRNYIGASGFSTYNTFDPILFVSSISIRWYFKNLVIIPSYGFQIRESKYYTVDNLLNVNTLTNKYNNHFITLTAKWTF